MAIGTSSLSALATYKTLTPERLSAAKVNFGKRPTIQADVEYFRAKVEKITSPDEFFKDYRVLKFALTAFGMESQITYPARIRQIMMSDPDDQTSLVNRMTDQRNRSIREAFGFFEYGVDKLKDADFVDGVVKSYVETSYDNDLSEMSPAAADALYFDRNIGSVTSSFQMIADPVMIEVVKTVLNIPNAALAGNITSVKEWIDREIPAEKIADPVAMKRLVERYLALKDVAQMKQSGNPLLGLFS